MEEQQEKVNEDIRNYIHNELVEMNIETGEYIYDLVARHTNGMEEVLINRMNNMFLDYEIKSKKKNIIDLIGTLLLWFGFGAICYIAGRGGI